MAYSSYRYRDYPYVILYIWKVDSVKTNSYEIPCLTIKQVATEVARCLNTANCEKIEVAINSCYFMNNGSGVLKHPKLSELSDKISPERIGKIKEASEKALSEINNELIPDTQKESEAKTHYIPNSFMICGDNEFYCSKECRELLKGKSK